MKPVISILLFFISTMCFSQENRTPFFPASTAIKTNLLYDLTTTMNLGVEFRTAPKYTLDITANYNPWSFSQNKQFKHLLIQPEFRYWTCEAFNGHFFGLHAMYGRFNIGGRLPYFPFNRTEGERHQGNLFGAGISYGYQWYLSPRWNLEATFGLGYQHLNYTTYECGTCGKELHQNNKNYFGPTKAGISLIYVIK